MGQCCPPVKEKEKIKVLDWYALIIMSDKFFLDADFVCFWGFLGVQTPLRPLIIALRDPDSCDLVWPNPGSFDTSYVDASVIGLESDGWLGVVGYEISFDMSDHFIFPNFFIESFWDFFVAVGGGECFVGNSCGICSDQDDFRGVLLDANLIHSAF